MKSTLNGLPDVARWVVENGLAGLRIQWLQPLGIEDVTNEVIGDSPDTRRAFGEVNKILRNGNCYFDYPYVTNGSKVLSVIAGMKTVKNKFEYLFFSFRKAIASFRRHGCRMAGFSLMVHHDSSLNLCPEDILPAGDVEKLSVSHVNSFLRKLRTSPPELCRQCRFFHK